MIDSCMQAPFCPWSPVPVDRNSFPKANNKISISGFVRTTLLGRRNSRRLLDNAGKASKLITFQIMNIWLYKDRQPEMRQTGPSSQSIYGRAQVCLG
jgi:hypothetical protein